MLYFAYGSNLFTPRLAERIGRIRLATVARLPAHRLAFHKRGRDGSGKCSVVATGNAADAVWGAVFRVTAAQRARLDRFEGVGAGYHVYPVRVATAEGPLGAFAYRADPEAVDPALLPFDWYRALVRAGAAEHGLPVGYRRWIAAVPVQRDPDGGRAARYRCLLKAAPD